jgi:hypothetical protein
MNGIDEKPTGENDRPKSDSKENKDAQ